ncbi:MULTISPECIES: hypothetical protein [Cellulosimicrobium]|uniref:Glycosyltransferase 2-like domain-containing protein n=1 Tax=Cellulosimicrobium cellulans F16 TaxID=1350482 RepID=A0A0M0F940_CELCE|nr:MULTISPECIES: hypothetical protein [Cellulosimicrobium]KON74099.1 hypothetical protein M768_08315 [Cellulosimicrobium cellulans F16]KZM79387.1 hypothetical protein A0J59_09620 [Cellulosimicrobium sp. I38E]
MRITAYVMAGDPAWATESLASYYDLVDRVVVSHDSDGLSWAGHPMPVEETIERLRRADPEGKIELLPGRWSDPRRFALDLDTEQRQAALDHAGKDADWVLQLDSDEIALAPDRLRALVETADATGAEALDYPLRHAYQRTLDGRLLELARRDGGVRASYPGPVAVRAGTALVHCRQTRARTYRVDLAPTNTDPDHPHDAVVDAVVRADEAVLHMSWVRTRDQMVRKSRQSGHHEGRDWDRLLRQWEWRARHPRLTVLSRPLRRGNLDWLRLADWPVGEGSGDWYGA